MATWTVICCHSMLVTAGMWFGLPRAADAAALSAEPGVVWHIPGDGRGTPSVRGSVAYFLSKRHEVIAVDVVTGRVRWRSLTGSPGDDSLGTRLVTTANGVVVGDYDVLSFGHDGGLRWRFEPRDGYGAGAYLGTEADGVVLAGSPSGCVYAIDVETGATRWSAQAGTDGRTTAFAPLVARGLVIAGFSSFEPPGSGGLAAFDLEAGALRWRQPFPVSGSGARTVGLSGGPVVAGQHVFAASRDGRIHAFDLVTGRVEWSLPPAPQHGDWLRLDEDYRAMWVGDRTIVAGSLSGTVVAYDLPTRRERWRRTPVRASISFGITGDDGAVYVPHLSGVLVSLDLVDGGERWRAPLTKSGAAWVPLAQDGRVYVAASGTGFFAFRR